MKELVFPRLLLPNWARQASQVGFVDAGTGREVTFGEHLSRVARLCAAVADELGVRPTDRVAVLSANSIPFLELWHAGLLGGFVTNPLNLRFAADELVHVLNDSGSEVCFVDATFAPAIAAIRERTGLRHVVLTGEGDVPCDVRYEELLGNAKERLPAEPEEDSPAALIYTGGTTGKPKGVVLDQRAEVLNQYHFAMALPWEDGGRFLIQTPMFHGASMLGVVGSPMYGNTTVVLPMFDPASSMQATARHAVTSTVLVPTMIGMIVNHPEFSASTLSSLRRIIYGASPMPRPLRERVLDLLPDTAIYHGYGMTEACTVLTLFPDSDPVLRARRGSCGRSLPGIELTIKDEDGKPVPTGSPGEVCARSGNITSGYLNLPEESAKALQDGWYHTGDIGYLDDEGYLFLVDRAKDMIISGGENIYSVEVENAIASHPEVVQVAVIGVPDATWGEAVHAVCVVKPGSAVTDTDIIAHARSNVAGYKVPRSVDLRTEPLPLSAAMKILKRELRAPFWADMDGDIS